MIYVKPGRGSGLIFTWFLYYFWRHLKILFLFEPSTSSNKAFGSLIDIFSAAITKSPLFKPAFSAGLFGITDWIKHLIVQVIELMNLDLYYALLQFLDLKLTVPKYGCITSPFWSWSETFFAVDRYCKT